MSKPIRINKYIASCGIASRRGADELIKEGKVKINDKVINEPGYLVSHRDKVTVNGKRLIEPEKRYFIFNKPAGYITTKNDPQERKTIYDILPPFMKDLNPAGRLDRASSGLLIMTNDGDLIQKLTHPKIHVPKVYRVVVEGKLTEKDFITLEKGIEIEEGKIAYAETIPVEYKDRKMTLQISLYQGYNRQIRRMMEHIEHPVVSLKRISHATIDLVGVEKGEYRKLLPKEINNLNKYLDKKFKKSERKTEHKNKKGE